MPWSPSSSKKLLMNWTWKSRHTWRTYLSHPCGKDIQRICRTHGLEDAENRELLVGQLFENFVTPAITWNFRPNKTFRNGRSDLAVVSVSPSSSQGDTEELADIQKSLDKHRLRCYYCGGAMFQLTFIYYNWLSTLWIFQLNSQVQALIFITKCPI